MVGMTLLFQDWEFVTQNSRGPKGAIEMTKGRVALPFRFDPGDDEQRVPPLRYAGLEDQL